MAYRAFFTGTWQDPWFEKLSPKAKLLFIYLWTNEVCSQSGVYEISQRRIEFETGIKFSEVIEELKPKVEWFAESNIVWVKAFFKRQCANPKFAYAAVRSLCNVPHKIVEMFTQHNQDLITKHGIDTVSIPYKTEVDTVCESVSVQISSDQISSVHPSKRNGIGFDDFWKQYPKRVGKLEAKRAWERCSRHRPPLDDILQKIENLKKTEQWTRDNGQYIPHPATWLNRGGWSDEVKTDVRSCTPPTWDD